MERKETLVIPKSFTQEVQERILERGLEESERFFQDGILDEDSLFHEVATPLVQDAFPHENEEHLLEVVWLRLDSSVFDEIRQQWEEDQNEHELYERSPLAYHGLSIWDFVEA